MRTTSLAPMTQRLVERQLRNWELARGSGAPRRDARQVYDFITISRQMASGGADVAIRLGEQLGLAVFGKEVLQTMASDDAVRARLYEWVDERDASWLEQFLDYLLRGRFPPHDYFYRLTRTVLTIARGAPAIFVGRGADQILPRDHGLRVRVVAPFEQRVERYARREGLEREAAVVQVRRIDRERAEFIQRHFHRDINDPTRADLTINMEHLSTEAAVRVIKLALVERGIVFEKDGAPAVTAGATSR